MSIRACLALAALLLLPSMAQADEPQRLYEMTAKGEIEIGPEGLVHDYRLKSDLTPAIAEIVDRNVRTWRFEPILIDGKPVIGKTMMRLALSASPAGNGNYLLKIENVWFGEPERTHALKPPRYPMDAVRAGLGAKVILVLKLDADGNVLDILPEQTSLTAAARNERSTERWRGVFEKASIAAARRWKFNPTERVNGQTRGSTIRVPVTYLLHDGPRPQTDGKWQAFVPGPVRPIPWVTPDAVASQDDRDGLRDGDVQPLDSRFKLKDEVVGQTL